MRAITLLAVGRRAAGMFGATRTWAVLALIGLLAVAHPAFAETLVTSLSSHRVLINSNYTGTSIAVFGAIERDAQSVSRASPYDVVVTVRGPRQFLTVREKERLGPVWLNQEQQKFPEAPAYLERPVLPPAREITSDVLRQRQKVGLAGDRQRARISPMTAARCDDPFREALLRLKGREGLYLEDERGVTFLTPSIFRAAIPLPAIAPPGNYDVEVMLFAETVILPAPARVSSW